MSLKIIIQNIKNIQYLFWIFNFRFTFCSPRKFRPFHSWSLRPNFCPSPLLELDPFRRCCHPALPTRIHRSGPLDLWTWDLKIPRSPTWYERLQVQRGLGPGDPGSRGGPRKCYRFISRKTHRKRSLKTLWWRFGGCCQCIESCPQQTSIYVTGEKDSKHMFWQFNVGRKCIENYLHTYVNFDKISKKI